MAFGTGLHPTTRRCLLELEKRIYPGGEVLDLGTGTGILAIAAAKLGARRVVALDIDPVAVKVAKQNIRLNQVQRKVMVKRGTLMPDAPERFDLIAANIVAAVLEKLAESMASSLKPQSAIIAGGIIAERLEGVVSRFAQAGLKVVKVLRDGEWRTVVAESPRY
jgi:ribosomal protein L11 methyltransferase